MTKNTILKINSSSRQQDSISRQVVDLLVDRLSNQTASSEIVNRDLLAGIPIIDETWIGANFTDQEQRSEAQLEKLSLSNTLVSELQLAEQIVIGVPIYNFSIPAVLKAWVDQVVRAKLTFQYLENGPRGLIENKKVYLVMAYGGTQIGSDHDFASKYMQHVLGFIGLTDVTIIDGSKVNLQGSPKEINMAISQQMGLVEAA